MKRTFIPITSSRRGRTPIREQRLSRFASVDGVTIHCLCGAAHVCTEYDMYDYSPFWNWVDLHGTHMPMLSTEPPEAGVVCEFADDGSGSMSPAIRLADGRVELRKQPENALEVAR